jgi:DNA-binding MarR family transcriptional regulator
MVVRAADVTRLIDRLDRLGLVRRDRSPHDGRAVLVSLTDEGAALLEVLDPHVHRAHRAQLGHLDEDELDTLNRLLTKARHRGERGPE